MSHAKPIHLKSRALSNWLLPRQALPLPQRYGGALLVTLGVLLAELGLVSAAESVPFFLPLVAVLLCSWFYGRGPGLFSGAISLCAGAGLSLAHFVAPGVGGQAPALSLSIFGMLSAGLACTIAQAGYRIECLEAQIRDQHQEIDESQDHLREESRQRGEAEAALREREAHYRTIVETSYEGILQIAADGKILFANQRMAEMVGRSLGLLRSRSIEELLPEEECQSFKERLDHRTRQGHQQYECRLRHLNGDTLWVSVSAGPLYSAEGSFRGTLAMFTDITERKATELALREAEARLSAFMENIPAVALIRDENGVYVAASRSYERSFGKAPEELIGKTPFDVFPHEVAQQLLEHEQEMLRDGRPRQFTQFVPGTDGTIRELLTDKFVLTDASGRRYVGSIAVDLTAQRGLENQLRQSQKMEAVGRLAGGVAHDFNNMLAVILGYTEVLSWRADLPRDIQTMLRDVHAAGERAASVTRQLLAFSRRQIVAPKALDLSEAVKSATTMLRRVIGEDIELVARLAPVPTPIHADPGQVEQVLWNLVVNARDAMPSGGKLTIETQVLDLDEVYAVQHVEVTPGAYVLLAVSDTGVGISPADQQHIFEPFFTTKEPGQGTGLGLATVFGIVKQHQGHIHLYSEPGHGTTFKVWLPRLDGAEKSFPGGSSAIVIPRGSETLLLVEDEELVRSVASSVLRQAGYTVLEATCGAEALKLLTEYQGTVHLMVSDVVMPNMSGSELLAQVKQLRPQLRALLMSGYTDDAIVRHGIVSAETAFIQKPFTASALAGKVREILDTTRSQPASG